MTTPDKPKRRGGNPAMVKGGPSINPHGRPRVGLSLANAVRERWPADRIVELATTLAESDDDAIRLRALEFLAERGYGKVPQAIDATISPGYSLDGERLLARLSTEALRELLEASEMLALDAAPSLPVEGTSEPGARVQPTFATEHPAAISEPVQRPTRACSEPIDTAATEHRTPEPRVSDESE